MNNRTHTQLRELGKQLAIAMTGGLIAVSLYAWMGPSAPETASQPTAPLHRANFYTQGTAPQDFVAASEVATPAVVHIRNKVKKQASSQRTPQGRGMPFDFFEFFGGPGFSPPSQGPMESAGSGVILTADGYIVTNHHVVDGADELIVTLFDNREYTATLIGSDPSTDLALVKIKERDLPFLRYGDSDGLRVGEWVLAVGNPFNLTSTVTAGIVSAKGRSLNLLEDKFRIESFIQTDAAVNPGNSGGALINVQGELVGINTAIASRTGSFAGYSFAVPTTIVRKVVDDLLKFGEVKRAFLGVSIRDVTGELAQQENLAVTKGVFVAEVNEGSAAQDAGLKQGDVITHVNGVAVNTSGALQEQIGQRRPGDKVEIAYYRGKTPKTQTVTLKGSSGETQLSEAKGVAKSAATLGAKLEAAPSDVLADLKLDGGVQVTELKTGKLSAVGVREGFVITHVNKKPIRKPQEVLDAIESTDGGILLEGLYPNGSKAFYAISF